MRLYFSQTLVLVSYNYCTTGVYLSNYYVTVIIDSGCQWFTSNMVGGSHE